MRAPGLILIAALALGGCERLQRAPDGEAERRNQPVPAAKQLAPGTTPMGQRVAVLGFLNKRNGISRDITLRPGQSLRIKDAIIRLRACETTPPWEFDKLTGAFVQLDVRQPNNQWKRVFSGWLYKESPSLNVVEHPVYDVWPKSCVMSFPEAEGSPAAPAESSSPSSASNSTSPERRAAETTEADTDEPAAPATEPPPPAEAPEPSAAESNAT